MNTLKRFFITGLLVLLPVSLSVWILTRVVIFFENILGPLFRNVLEEAYRPGLGLVSLLLLIFIVGFLASNILGRKIVTVVNRVMERLPLFNRVYLTIKGVSDSVFGGQDQMKFFEGVALVSFPDRETKTIGFITAAPADLRERYLGVFVPTTPNITTGFYLLFPHEEVIRLDMTVEEGLKTVLSFGMTSRISKNGAADGRGKAGQADAR